MSEVSVAADMLQSFVRRIESLDDEILALNSDKSEVYKELKGQGFEVKVVRKLVADRRKDASERAEFETIYELYAEALGMRLYRHEGDNPGHVRAHVENIEEFPVGHDEDGVFPDDEQQSAPAARDLTSDLIPQGDSGQVASHTPEMATTFPIVAGDDLPADEPGANASKGVTGGESAATNITQLRAPKPFRPNCLNRDKCGGQGPVECWSCTKAASERKEASA